MNISQRGACLELHTPQRVGREISLERLNNKGSTRAKIAWVQQKDGGKYLIGVEILDNEDFWASPPLEPFSRDRFATVLAVFRQYCPPAAAGGIGSGFLSWNSH